MPGDVDYAREKYSAARRTLADGDSPLRDRLGDAYASQAIRVMPLRPGVGPLISHRVAERIEALHRDLTGGDPGAGGAVVDNVRALDDGEVAAFTRELLDIAAELDAEYYFHHPADDPGSG
ncbi:MAG TPA: hypothetical protein VFU19_11445 [Iamia sp.]|nr:hypothetical protein [Iamia sp.]